MSLRFELSATPVTEVGETQPIAVSTTERIYVHNDGLEDLTGLGFYILPATTYGDYESQHNKSPHADFYRILAYGNAVESADDVQGGLLVTVQGEAEQRVYTGAGDSLANKIGNLSILSGSYKYIDLTFETPTGAPGEIAFIDLMVE